jgi:hypothetical protein
MVLLGVSVFVAVVSFGLEWRAHELLGRVERIGDVDQSTLNSVDIQLGLVGLAQIGLLIGTAITFLTWVYRAHKNLDSLGVRTLEFTHGWAVGSWFVPFLNLFRPKKVMDEIWHGSGTLGNAAIIPVWWGCWIFSGIVTRLSTASSRVSPDPGTLANGFLMMMVADVLMVVAGVAAIRMTRSIQAAQDAKAVPHIMVRSL